MSLNPEQRQAVEHVRGPLLILAGAGSGKTRVITHRVQYMIQRGIPPEHILAVSFTNKAAREMRERVTQMIGKSLAGRVNLSTFHSLGVSLLRSYIEELGYSNPFTILDPGDQIAILREVLEEVQGASLKRQELRSVQSIISRAKNEYCQPRDLKAMRFNPMVPYAQKAFLPYVKACKALNGVDFDDLLVLPLKLFHNNPDILHEVRGRYRYIMVDEYQDTNAVQLLLLRVMGAPRNNVCVVGDDDQSIYAFRGAVFKNILEFERHFSGARVIKLEQNYRSTSRILSAANAVIRNNKHRRKKTLWSALGSGDQLRFVELEDEQEEASFIAGDILRERLSRKRPWRDFAILFRTATLSRHLEEALQDEQIPYRLQGGTEFFDRREVKDLAAYLRVLINPADEIGLRRSLNIPSRGLGHTTLGRLSEFAEEQKIPLYQALVRAREVEGVGPKQRQSIEGYLDLIRDFRQRFQAKRMDLAFEELLQQLDYRAWMTRGEKSEKVTRIRLQHIDEIVSSLASFQDRGGSLDGYVSRLSLRDAPREKNDEEEDEVTLMTLHASKGLEFPCVYMVGFEEELLPHARSMEVGADGDLEEERRLAYVGITRARERLVMTSSHYRGRGHARKRRNPSRFLHEIPDEVIRVSRHGEPDEVEDDKSTGREFLKLIHAALE